MSRDNSHSAFPWLLLTEPGEPRDPITGKEHGLNERSRHVQTGMSLRDYFAAKAMQAAATNPTGADGFTFEQRAEWAYKQADAMLAERAK